MICYCKIFDECSKWEYLCYVVQYHSGWDGGNKVNTAKNVEFGNIIRSFPNLLCKKIMRNFRGKIQSRIQTSLVFGDVFWK